MALDTIARRYGTDPWTVASWPPERVALAWACIEAARARRDTLLTSAGPDGRKPSVMVTLPVGEM